MLIRVMTAAAIVALTAVRGDKLREVSGHVAPTACRAADSNTAREIKEWQTKMRGTSKDDSLYVSRRGMVNVPDSAFAVVTDPATCARALMAHNSDAEYDARELASAAASTVYVIRVGPRYITWNPDFPSGEWVSHTVWNSSFVALEHYLA